MQVAPKDRWVTVSTVFVFVILVGMAVLLIALPPHDFSVFFLPEVYIPYAFITTMLLVAFALVPRSYTVSSYGIKIERTIGNVSIPLHLIASIKKVDVPNIGYKMFANAGLFGYYGLFFSEDDHKTVRIYATTLRNVVRVETANGKVYYISPVKPEMFVEIVNQYIKSSSWGGNKS